VWRSVAVAAAVGGAFTVGVVTGVVGSRGAGSGVLDQAAEQIASTAARPVDRAALDRAAVEGMLGALGDRWSSYYTPGQYESFQESLSGRYSGVGIWLRPGVRADQPVRVGSVAPGSPAAEAGVSSGDVLLSVDGHRTAPVGVGDVVGWLRGADGTQVALTVRRDGVRHTVTVTRESLVTSDVSTDPLAGGILAIRVHAFTRGVGRQVRDALSNDPIAHRGGVILDLRGNPGGLLDEAVEVASAFLDGGPVVSYERRGAPDRLLQAMPGGDTTTPMAVLVDGSSASAAEVVAAALQDRGRAVIVGQRTYGKGSVQEPFRLQDGSALELTVGRYLTPSGRSIDGHGVEPDVLVPDGSDPEVAQSRAMEVLRGLMAALPLGSQG
jgi:carboxyl-terminal processing protease